MKRITHVLFPTFGVAALLATAAMTTPAGAESVASPPEIAKPQIEVVFVLDTTGSMSGLIQAAKEKIWSIANSLTTTKPAPDIKMGLVGFRDRGDDYVTKVTDLTDDLDAVYAELMGFQAQGGGDTPESVNQALRETVKDLSWSRQSKDTYKVIFLVGDSPPHMDYEQDVLYPDTCKSAVGHGIYINTIQCGNNTDTTPIWSDIAKKAEGRYFRVEQDGSAILASTPFDAELAELSRELDETLLYYGTKDEKQALLRRKAVGGDMMAEAAPAAAASRAVFNASEAGAKNLFGKQELVDDVTNGRLALADLDEEALPEPMQKMTPEERKAHIEKMAGKREETQAKIAELAKKRQGHIEKQMRESNLDAKQTLDHAVFDCIKEQAGKQGIEYKGGPAL